MLSRKELRFEKGFVQVLSVVLFSFSFSALFVLVVGVSYPEASPFFDYYPLVLFPVAVSTIIADKLSVRHDRYSYKVLEFFAVVVYFLLVEWGIETGFSFDFGGVNALAVVFAFLSVLVVKASAIAVYSPMKLPNRILSEEVTFENREEFVEWLKGYLETRSVSAETKKLSSRVVGMVLVSLIAGNIVYENGRQFEAVVYLLVEILSGLLLVSNSYKVSLYVDWIIRDVEVARGFFENWAKYSMSFVLILALLLLVLPADYQLLSWNKITEKLSEVAEETTQGLTKGENIETLKRKIKEEAKRKKKFGERKVVASGRNSFDSFISYVLIPGAVAFVVFGVVGGVLNRIYKFREKPKWIRFFISVYGLFRVFFDLIVFVLLSVVRFVGGVFRPRLTARPEPQDNLAQEIIDRLFSKKKMSKEKMEEIETIVTLFVKFVRTASLTTVPYRSSYGPVEYVEMVAGEVPELAEDLEIIGTTFAESRYSDHLLGKDKIELYAKVVRETIAELSTLKTIET